MPTGLCGPLWSCCETLLTASFIAAVDKPLSSADEFITVERFAHGGMTSGAVHFEWWRTRGIPLLNGDPVLPRHIQHIVTDTLSSMTHTAAAWIEPRTEDEDLRGVKYNCVVGQQGVTSTNCTSVNTRNPSFTTKTLTLFTQYVR